MHVGVWLLGHIRNLVTTTVLDKLYLKYVEIKCQLDATEVFIADLIACSTCFGHHYAHHQELKSIIKWLKVNWAELKSCCVCVCVCVS